MRQTTDDFDKNDADNMHENYDIFQTDDDNSDHTDNFDAKDIRREIYRDELIDILLDFKIELYDYGQTHGVIFKTNNDMFFDLIDILVSYKKF